ncbi:glutamate 5-kinase [Mobilisporobacter senegalensis]|uniref:Glutamate 5-kinase n=1 Tax=Mobilisporobacter senegalensis TaxID=1329262 RepID=A0A3N1XWK3_9FIRM|nr:glutamate 5-kinase [Mobilisporobacter senegalensis]ROR29317.1 glutamate 5-kinase [Mobilisporobacter senegalensis]
MNREVLKEKKRIVIKIGSSSLTHEQTGNLNLAKMEKLVRVLTDLRNQGKEVVLVSSGAIAVGREAVGIKEKPKKTSVKQACAAVGQAKLMMVYQKLFAEYNQLTAQILMTKYTMINDISRKNARDTFEELLTLGVIPIVNENDTVSTDELEFGDNDTLSAIVTALIQGDILILLSDIDGLYTDDPHKNPEANFIEYVETIDESLEAMGKGSNSMVGTGGMATKISAARIATNSGADMVIANGDKVSVITKIMNGENIGTLFQAHKDEKFKLINYISTKQYSR